jgi:type 1 fimbria pilin
MKKMFKMVAALSLVCAAPAWAYRICTPSVPSVTISGATILVQRDAKVGDPLSDLVLTSPIQVIYTCPSTPIYSNVWQNFGFKTTSTLWSGSSSIYMSSYTGLGFMLGGSLDTGSIYWLPSSSSTPLDGNPNQIPMRSVRNGNLSSSSGSAKIKLYKTGTLSSGVFSGKVGSFILGSSVADGGGWATEVPINVSALTITVLACTLSTPSISVPLGNVQAGLFTGVGSTLGTKSFNLGLNCNAGTNVNVSISGTQNTDTANTSVLALSGAGNADVAKGVGAQILYNNAPLKIGENLLLKTSTGGVETFGFQARYFQTLATVMPGKANASATLNITYQ